MFQLFTSFFPIKIHIYTHTHTIYIYIYIYKQKPLNQKLKKYIKGKVYNKRQLKYNLNISLKNKANWTLSKQRTCKSSK